MEDVLNSPLEVITYKGTYDEGFFRYAPKESIFHQIFVKKILNSPGAFVIYSVFKYLHTLFQKTFNDFRTLE